MHFSTQEEEEGDPPTTKIIPVKFVFTAWCMPVTDTMTQIAHCNWDPNMSINHQMGRRRFKGTGEMGEMR